MLRLLPSFWVLYRVSERQKSSILKTFKFPRFFQLWSWRYVRCRIFANFSSSLSSWKGLRRHLVISTPRKHKFLSSRVSYYPNSVSSFHHLRLVLSGDVQLNPGPTASASRTIQSWTVYCWTVALQQNSGIPRVSLWQQLRRRRCYWNVAPLAILMVKYYLLPCIQYSERIEAVIKGVVVFYLLWKQTSWPTEDLTLNHRTLKFSCVTLFPRPASK